MSITDFTREFVTSFLDPSGESRGKKAVEQLMEEGQHFLSRRTDNFNTSVAFMAADQAMFKAGNFAPYQLEEALISKEIEEEKKKYKDSKTKRVFDPVDYEAMLRKPGGWVDTFIPQYKKDREKAKVFELASGLSYGAKENIEDLRIKYSAATIRSLNKAKREIYNSYGWDKDIFRLFGIGKDTDLVEEKVGDYSFLLHEEDTELKRKFLASVAAELQLGESSLTRLDVEQLSEMYKKLSPAYTPAKTGTGPTLGGSRENPNTGRYIFAIEEGRFPLKFKEMTFSSLTGEDVPFYQIIDNIDTETRPRFFEDWRFLSATALNIMNKAEVIPLGGTKDVSDITEITLRYLFDRGNFVVDRRFVGGIDVLASYTELSGRQKRVWWDDLPDYLNFILEIEELSPEQQNKLMEAISLERSNSERIDRYNDPLHPLNRAELYIKGQGKPGDENYLSPISFRSEEDLISFISNDVIKFKAKDYDPEDIDTYINIMETAPISDITSIDAIQNQLAAAATDDATDDATGDATGDATNNDFVNITIEGEEYTVPKSATTAGFFSSLIPYFRRSPEQLLKLKESRAESPYARKRRKAQLLDIKKREEARLLDIKNREEAQLLDIKKREERKARQNIKSGGTVSLLDRDK